LQQHVFWADALVHGIGKMSTLKQHSCFKETIEEDLHGLLHFVTGLYSVDSVIGLRANLKSIKAFSLLCVIRQLRALNKPLLRDLQYLAGDYYYLDEQYWWHG